MDRKCRKCQSIIPTRTIIDGKIYYHRNRKFCFICSPWKNKNGSGQQYSSWSEERKERHRQVATKKGRERKKELVDLAGGQCSNCGYNKCLKALNFHHIEAANKLFTLDANNIKSKSWDSILTEFDKCVLLCSNCHIELHSKHYEDYENVELIEQKSSKLSACPSCGEKRKYKHNGLCKNCRYIASRKTERPSQEVLKIQVEKMGYSATGRLYNVSDNCIRNWLK